MILALIILVFSVVQSIFGMGLLVFGTPTLLLLGYSFLETLGLLLPASFFISVLQVRSGSRVPKEFRAYFYYWCIPALVVGLTIHLYANIDFPIEIALSAIMFLFAAVRIAPGIRRLVVSLLSKNQPSCMLTMGLVHGFSNMGGSLLAIVASARFDNKQEIRSSVAFCYMTFSMVQITIILLVTPNVITVESLKLSVLSVVTYLVVGQKLFSTLAEGVFDKAFTFFFLLYSLILGLKGVAVI